jgi:hypothetical protein
MLSGSAKCSEEIADREGCSPRKVNMILTLAFLAPEIVKAAIDGRLPRGVGIFPPLRPSSVLARTVPTAWYRCTNDGLTPALQEPQQNQRAGTMRVISKRIASEVTDS